MHDLEQSAGDHEVLEEVDHHILVGEIMVEDYGRNNAPEHQCGSDRADAPAHPRGGNGSPAAAIVAVVAVYAKALARSRLIFVASPSFIATHPISSEPAGIANVPFLSFFEEPERPTWAVQGPDGVSRVVTFNPILWTSEFDVLIEAACSGAGIALLPVEMVRKPIAEARLVRVLPGWHSVDVTIHIVFPTARGMRPAVRAFVEHVAATFEMRDSLHKG